MGSRSYGKDGAAMKCSICHEGYTETGLITALLERSGVTVIIQEVPALICQNCGEEYLEEEISSKLLKQADEAVKAGTLLEIRKFAA
ncbi:MAG: type II toxin-antitoxin system MqsA family antitoxin [bacterium]